jgi:hypothetical protein
MGAEDFEINLSKVYELLDELKTGKLVENYGTGYDERVYNKNLSKEHLDYKTAELCSKLTILDVTKYSPEMQIWWREHRKADRKRILKSLKSEKKRHQNSLGDLAKINIAIMPIFNALAVVKAKQYHEAQIQLIDELIEGNST